MKRFTWLLVVGVGLVAIVFVVINSGGKRCGTSEKRVVHGASLGQLVPEGSTVNLKKGYYDCHEVKREDIVAYEAPGQPEPVIKVARGLPGDTFEVLQTPEGNRLLVNGNIVQTSDNVPYTLSDNRYEFFNVYAEQYQGVIPPDNYLLLGNIPSGSIDSILFGFINKSQIIGKIVP
jgi:signal peptidase I